MVTGPYAAVSALWLVVLSSRVAIRCLDGLPLAPKTGTTLMLFAIPGFAIPGLAVLLLVRFAG